MNKSVIIGIVVLLVVVAGGVGYKFYSDGKLAGILPGAPGTTSAAETVKPAPLVIGAASGYSLGNVTLDGESVPLVKIPLDIWGGYAALFAANGGSAPNKNSLFFQKGKFAVELVNVEGAKAQLDGFAAGLYPIIWSSMDSLPMLYDALRKDRRVVPQVAGLFDWSFGGDGILVRDSIKTPKDLVGKKILTSGNTPYNFFLLWLLAQSGISPSDVKMVYIGEGPAALEAFKNDKSIDAWVTWSPFLTDAIDSQSASFIKDARLLITSRDANQLIADVYVSRLDFAKEHPEILAAFTEALLLGEQQFEKQPDPVFANMAAFYKLAGGANEAKGLVKNVHLANYTESRMFFNMDNPINAYKIFFMAQEYYKNLGALPSDASYEAEAVINTSFLDKAGATKAFDQQPNRVLNSFNKQSAFDITDLENQRVVLANNVELFFDAQKIDFDLKDSRPEIQKNKALLDNIAEQMSVLGTTVVKLIGHLDTTKVEEFKAQGQQAYIEASAQAKLISKKRAEFIKKVLIENYQIDKERLVTEGKGWDQPIDIADPTRNRRVEVRFLSFE
jgi:ABC-type nitrate/sulfonate/bicarbonate transport system substrate-binding protein/outer membrane protein OmpA-like peptidoglycan-associated protein